MPLCLYCRDIGSPVLSGKPDPKFVDSVPILVRHHLNASGQVQVAGPSNENQSIKIVVI